MENNQSIYTANVKRKIYIKYGAQTLLSLIVMVTAAIYTKSWAVVALGIIVSGFGVFETIEIARKIKQKGIVYVYACCDNKETIKRNLDTGFKKLYDFRFACSDSNLEDKSFIFLKSDDSNKFKIGASYCFAFATENGKLECDNQSMITFVNVPQSVATFDDKGELETETEEK